MIAFARGLQCTLPSITSTRTRLSNYSHPLSRDLRVLRRCTRSRYSRGLCKLGGATELLSTAECIRTSRTNSTTHSRTLSLLARHSDTMSMQSRGMSVFAVCTRCCNRRAAHISDHRNHARDIDQLPYALARLISDGSACSRDTQILPRITHRSQQRVSVGKQHTVTRHLTAATRTPQNTW